MKALSLWQPWATLIAIGAKKIETRSWATNYRGPLLICSAKRPLDRETREWMDRSSLFRAALRKEQPMGLVNLPLGEAVCVVSLVDCRRTLLMNPSTQEREFGNFGLGRYGWILEDVQRIDGPFSIRGAQGLFDVPAEVEAEVRRKVGMSGVHP